MFKCNLHWLMFRINPSTSTGLSRQQTVKNPLRRADGSQIFYLFNVEKFWLCEL